MPAAEAPGLHESCCMGFPNNLVQPLWDDTFLPLGHRLSLSNEPEERQVNESNSENHQMGPVKPTALRTPELPKPSLQAGGLK